MGHAETLGDVGGIDDVVAVGPGGFGFAVVGEATGDEEAGTVEGGFAVGVVGGVEVGVVCWHRRVLAQWILLVDSVGVGVGEFWVVVLHEG